jgi:hypothetical protein
MTPIISMTNKEARILVSIPATSRIPPITSSNLITTASSYGRPSITKKPCVCCISKSFGHPVIMKMTPTRILIDTGPKAISLRLFLIFLFYSTQDAKIE